MGWLIKCTTSSCKQQTWAPNIVDLIEHNIDSQGWVLCSCGKQGYIEKVFELMEPGETWEPYLRGVIPLGDEDDTYQPFVFLVSYAPNSKPKDVWFSYYKDLRADGGRLKLGYGPGGPPVLSKKTFLQLSQRLLEVGFLSEDDVNSIGRKGNERRQL
jgi:hypothetical protein